MIKASPRNVSDKLLTKERKKERQKERKKERKKNNKKRSKHNMSPKFRLGDIIIGSTFFMKKNDERRYKYMYLVLRRDTYYMGKK